MKKGQWAINSDGGGLLCTSLLGKAVFTDDFEDGGEFAGCLILFESESEAHNYIVENQIDWSCPAELDYYLHF